MALRRRGCLRAAWWVVLVSMGLLRPAGADDIVNIDVTIKDHRFQPSEIHVPTGKPATLTITNKDNEAEEFESAALKVEKVIPAGRSAIVRLRPLGPGRYAFMGEYHANTATGAVVSE